MLPCNIKPPADEITMTPCFCCMFNTTVYPSNMLDKTHENIMNPTRITELVVRDNPGVSTRMLCSLCEGACSDEGYTLAVEMSGLPLFRDCLLQHISIHFSSMG